MRERLHYSLAGGPVGMEALEGLSQEVPFSTEEYRERVRRVRQGMEALGVEVLLVTDPANVFYLSGYQTFSVYNGECVILSLDGDPSLVVDRMEVGGALLHSWLERAFGYDRDMSRPAYLSKLLAEQGLDQARVALEKGSRALTVQLYEGLTELLPKARFSDGTAVVREAKAVKSPQEIEYLRRAAQITALGMRAAIEAVAEGKSDNLVASSAYRALIEAGSEYMCHDPVVTTGRRSGILHSTHKRVSLEKGDVILLEMGGCFQRYTAPMMRTATLGEPSPEVRQVADACLAALSNVLGAIRPGITAAEVAESGWEGIKQAGNDLFFHGNFGYAVGAGLPPSWADGTAAITLEEETILRPGMVFHHPIAVRKLGRFGVAFSETSVVTEDGCEVLNGVDRRLFVK